MKITIEVPDNATNGDVIKKLFPKIVINTTDGYDFFKSWLTSYYIGVENKKIIKLENLNRDVEFYLNDDKYKVIGPALSFKITPPYEDLKMCCRNIYKNEVEYLDYSTEVEIRI